MQSNILLKVSDDDPDVAYVYFSDHPGVGKKVKGSKQVRLSDLVSYIGPELYFDIDSSGRLIGVEILA